ncbi:MAG: gamma-glutamylcyclotransferase family protein [Hyphomicrobium sp.]
MTANTSRYLFVYGTLMSGARSALGVKQRLRLAEEADSLGPSSLHFARLYDLGSYPGAAISDGEEDIVHGEVVLLADPDAALAWLDDYEGYVHGAGDSNEYDRLVREVRLAGGETFDAWVYLLRRAPGETLRIANGRWIGR